MDRCERRAQAAREIEHQLRIAEACGRARDEIEAQHQYSKRTWANCGVHGCLYCQNPRKRGELPVQELRERERILAGLPVTAGSCSWCYAWLEYDGASCDHCGMLQG